MGNRWLDGSLLPLTSPTVTQILHHAADQPRNFQGKKKIRNLKKKTRSRGGLCEAFGPA